MRREIVGNEMLCGVVEDARSDYAYYAFMALSGVLAAVAFLTDSIPLLLGAMIVAPAYPPLAAISFAIAGGVPVYAGRASLLMAVGLVLAVTGAIATTWFCEVTGLIDPETSLTTRPLLEERARVGWYSILAALAAGAAGTIAVIERKRDTLIGIVASIALVPAAAAGGIALYAGDGGRAIGGLLLLAVNVLVIIALGLLVLIAIRPARRQSPRHRPDGFDEVEAAARSGDS